MGSFRKFITLILLVVIKTSPAVSGSLRPDMPDYAPSSVAAQGLMKAGISKTLRLKSGRRYGLSRQCFTPYHLHMICIYTTICHSHDPAACRIESYPPKPRYATAPAPAPALDTNLSRYAHRQLFHVKHPPPHIVPRETSAAFGY